MTCAHSGLPDLGGDNPLSLKQCPDCHAAVYWDERWRLSKIKLDRPNVSPEGMMSAFVLQCAVRPRISYQETIARSRKRRAAKPLNCPHCGALNDYVPKEKITCKECGREFQRSSAHRFNIRRYSLEKYRNAWVLFAQGNMITEVARELKIGGETAHRWHHLWKAGVKLPNDSA